MYAVIRAGGKQYRVAPGDVIRIEKLAENPGPEQKVEFPVLAISSAEGQIGRPQGEARVVGRVVGEGRGDKVLVFHYKRKKQYKRLRGHRQPYTAVRITEMTFEGQRFAAPEEPAPEKPKKTKPEAAAPEVAEAAAPKKAAAKRPTAAKAKAGKSAKKAAPKRKK